MKTLRAFELIISISILRNYLIMSVRHRRPSGASVTTATSSSSSSRSTAHTSPLLNNPLLVPPESHAKNGSTSRPYYPTRPQDYMSFHSFPNPSTTSPPALSQSPSPIPVPNPSMPFMMPVPDPDPEPEPEPNVISPPLPADFPEPPAEPDIAPPLAPLDIRDSGVDFGPGVLPPSGSGSVLSPLPVNPEVPEELSLFRARSMMGFAKSQSRLGFFKHRPPSLVAPTDLDSVSDSELAVAPHFATFDQAARALLNELRPIMESCIEIVVRLIPAPKVSLRLHLGREEEVCSMMEATLRHLWSCITLRPGCACPREEEQWELPQGQRGSDICREFHEAFERKLRRFTSRMRHFHDQIDRPRRMYKTSFTERLLGWQDAFDQWINRFERLTAYLRLRLAHAHARQLHLQLEHERAALEDTPSSRGSDAGSADSPRSQRSLSHRHHRMLTIEQLKDEYDVAKSALLEAHKRAAGLAWRRDEMGQLVRDFGTWAIRDAV
ncbi:hypothetical protein D9757_004637 [Collybiopsis confluens]|uniref:Uncharacterized protein n=1 Tax=Collybiopsis confluens TaxID=2823264 RepID=A0A8H5HS87_9AGAR|nr:hypothetical protein D9757_004637 [Collybiopsis confluens]